jgi:hypothetical protein
MSIREIARTLYQVKKHMEELERAFQAEAQGAKRDSLQRELFKARAEYERAKNILEGQKEEPSDTRW